MKRILAIGIVALVVCVIVPLLVYVSSTERVLVDTQTRINPYDLFDIKPKTVDLKGYDEAKGIIDTILDASGLETFDGEIVGVLEHGDLKILLIDQENTVLEVAWDGTNTWTYTLIPELLGSKEYPISANHSEKYIFGPKRGIELYRLKIQIPADTSDVGVLYMDIYDVWREDWWEINGGKNLLHTEGRFYINYGNEVEKVIDYSYIKTMFGFANCTFEHSTIGEGTCAGEVDTYALWALYDCPVTAKFSVDAWVSTDCWLNTDDDAHHDKWVAISCGCYV